MKADFKEDIFKCIEVLESGGIILYPTDTVWGLGCDATNPEAIQKIYTLKKRPETKSMILLAEDENMINQYVDISIEKLTNLLNSFSKPTTVIYNDPKGLPDNLIASEKTIAFRIPKDPFCNELLNLYKRPIVSTSANLSGEDTPIIFSEIKETIKNGVDFIVQHRSNEVTPAQPSTLISVNKDWTFNILRN